MTEKLQLNRRTFLAANAAVAAAATVPGQALACTKGEAHSASAPMSWETVTPDQMAGLVGERFRVNSPETGDLVMQLVAVEPGNSGAARPAGLPRSESLVAVFDSPDKAPIVDCGCGIYRVNHARLGAADLYMGPSPLRKGDHVLEMVLG